MARVTFNRAKFTGSVGPVAFRDGEAETEVPAMLAHFRRMPDTYTVHEDPETDQGDQGEGSDEHAPIDTGEQHGPDTDPDKSDGEDGEDEPVTPVTPVTPYAEQSRNALRKLASERGLPVGGSRDELAERLTNADAAKAEDDAKE